MGMGARVAGVDSTGGQHSPLRWRSNFPLGCREFLGALLFFLVAEHLYAHRLVLWNPWTSAGAPDFAEPQIGSTSLSFVGGDASTAADRIHRVPDGGLGRRWTGHAALDSQCAK